MGVDAVRTSRFDKLAPRASLDEERSDEARRAGTREAIAFQSIQHWQSPDTPAAKAPRRGHNPGHQLPPRDRTAIHSRQLCYY